MTIKESLKNWKEGTYGKSVAKFPERKKRFKTSSFKYTWDDCCIIVFIIWYKIN